MIHFKTVLRSSYLSAAGCIRRPRGGVHILAGHLLNRGEEGHTSSLFFRQLERLSRFCRFVDFNDAVSLIRQGDESQSRPTVAFSFDDGFSDCYEYIAPVLNNFDVKAAFFINPNYCLGSAEYIDRFSSEAVLLPGKKPMSADNVRDLSRQGHIIGAHTVDHALLTSTDRSFLHTQIVTCRAMVESLSGVECDSFAWTYGGYKHISREAIEMARGVYKNIFSSDNSTSYLGGGGGYPDIINRRHFEPNWPSSHVRYFISQAKSYD